MYSAMLSHWKRFHDLIFKTVCKMTLIFKIIFGTVILMLIWNLFCQLLISISNPFDN